MVLPSELLGFQNAAKLSRWVPTPSSQFFNSLKITNNYQEFEWPGNRNIRFDTKSVGFRTKSWKLVRIRSVWLRLTWHSARIVPTWSRMPSACLPDFQTSLKSKNPGRPGNAGKSVEFAYYPSFPSWVNRCLLTLSGALGVERGGLDLKTAPSISLYKYLFDRG